ncbi:MAG: hypothetical protein K9K67_14810 [Bacteriovoracaceae bacterium]|nr:hypothetical protein [Bacteriovoracaceae bacterium]
MKVILFGASGLVGQSLLNDCIMSSEIKTITVVLRKEFPLLQSDKISVVINPLTDLESLKAQLDSDICFCCLGSTINKAGSKEAFRKVDYEIPLQIAKLFKEANPSGTFAIITARGADKDSSIFYNKVKGQLEEELKALNLFALVIVRPSLIIGSRQESRPLEFISQKVFCLLEPLLKRFAPGVRGIPAAVISNGLIMTSLDPIEPLQVYESDELWSFYEP